MRLPQQRFLLFLLVIWEFTVFTYGTDQLDGGWNMLGESDLSLERCVGPAAGHDGLEC
jgi:hypothetical protein